MPTSDSFSAQPRPAPSRIGLTDVERLEDTITLLRARDYRRGGGVCRHAVTAELAGARTLLAAQARSAVKSRLLVTIADLHNLAGWIFFDTGHPAAARRCFAEALDFAGAANHHALMANIHYRRGRVHLHHHQPVAASQEFHRGTAAAQRARSPLSAAILHANQAWAHAKTGARNAALSCLGEAADAFAAAEVSDAPSWAAFFGSTDLTAMAGTVHTELALTTDPGYTEFAIPALTEATGGYTDAMRRSRAICLAALAVDHLLAGDHQHAAKAAAKALDTARGVSSVRVAERMAPLRRLLGHHRHDFQLRDLAHRLDRYLDRRPRLSH